MPENPYESPKTLEPVTPPKAELFDRLGGYLRWAFRIGLLLIILSAFIHMRADGPLDIVLNIVSITGTILVIISLVGIIPLSIWGFINGFREGRINSSSNNS